MQSGALPLLSGKHMTKIMKFRLQKSKHSLQGKTGCFIAAYDLENRRISFDIKYLAQFYTNLTAKPKLVPHTPNCRNGLEKRKF